MSWQSEQLFYANVQHRFGAPEPFVGHAFPAPLQTNDHLPAHTCLEGERLLSQALGDSEFADATAYLAAI